MNDGYDRLRLLASQKSINTAAAALLQKLYQRGVRKPVDTVISSVSEKSLQWNDFLRFLVTNVSRNDSSGKFFIDYGW